MADHRFDAERREARLGEKMEEAKKKWREAKAGGRPKWNRERGEVDDDYLDYLKAERNYNAALPGIGREQAYVDYYKALRDAAPHGSEARTGYEDELAEAKAERQSTGAVTANLARLNINDLRWTEDANGAAFANELVDKRFLSVGDAPATAADAGAGAVAAAAAAPAAAHDDEDGNEVKMAAGDDPEGDDGGIKVLSLDRSDWVVFNKGLRHIVSRQHTRRLYDAVWEWAEGGLEGNLRGVRRLLVLGNPGIGKSAGLTYLLRRALAFGTKCVVLQASNVGTVFRFDRAGDDSGGPRYRCYTCPNSSFFVDRCKALEEQSTLFLYDPPNSTSSASFGALPIQVTASCVVASSPSIAKLPHFDGFRVYMPAWSEADLAAAAPYLFPERPMTASDVAERYATLGGTVRYALSESQMYESYCEDQTLQASDLTDEILDAALGPRAVVKGGISTKMAPSFLFQIGPSGTAADPDKKFKGYENKSVISFLSPRALLLAARKHAVVVARRLARTQPDDGTAAGWMFEEVALRVVARTPQLVGAEDDWPKLKTIRCDPVERIKAHGAERNTLLVPKRRNYPAVDAVAVLHDGRVCAIQVTVASSHPEKRAKLAELGVELALKAPGVTSESQTGRPLHVVPQPFDLCFVVPWYRKADYEGRTQSYEGEPLSHPHYKRDDDLGHVSQRVVALAEDNFVASVQNEAVAEAVLEQLRDARPQRGSCPAAKRRREY